jgi:beta-glucanase (GH16 family)
LSFTESFNNGVGRLSHTWGNVDTSVSGQITLRGESGAMEPHSGPWSGNGYGTYTVVASMSSDGSAGPAALLWPGDNVWPGAEYDIVEIINGTPYGTVHYNDRGSDGWQSVFFNGVNEGDVNTYTLDWQPDQISFSVNGRHYGTVTGIVGDSAADGGTNSVLSVMNHARNSSDTYMTVYEVSYSAGGESWSGASADVDVEWNNSVEASADIWW